MSQFKKIHHDDLKPVIRPPLSLIFQIFGDFGFKFKILGLWEPILNRYVKYFDGNLKGNYSAFQNGLIYDFIISSCLTMFENVKGGRHLKGGRVSWNELFLTFTLFTVNAIKQNDFFSMSDFWAPHF